MTMAGEALKEAREGEFAKGVGFGSLEATLLMETPSLRGAHRTDLWLRIFKAVMLIAPFAGLVAPRVTRASRARAEGCRAPCSPMVWTAACSTGRSTGPSSSGRWGRDGRSSTGGGSAGTRTACGRRGQRWPSSPRSSCWPRFPSLLSSEEYRTVAPFVVATAVPALVALVAMRMWSRPPSRYIADRLRMEDSVRAVPEEERRALLAERSRVAEVLLERDLITPAAADVAARLEPGQWWRLDDNAGPDHRIST
uniref:Uncharacterized protein n=1 Tax=Janibacter limosus TaxID=53458 RepID=A0AC61U4I3_9MICO|nr:hypothetical protein [Janibacter limosus]